MQLKGEIKQLEVQLRGGEDDMLRELQGEFVLDLEY